jgi:antitoxin (DNA-binding transcriptional repressor) of toxin-antitoxin stability system
MERVDVGQLKAGLETYLGRVQAGEVVQVCEGAEVVATITGSATSDGILVTRRATRSLREAFDTVAPVELDKTVDAVALLRRDRDER